MCYYHGNYENTVAIGSETIYIEKCHVGYSNMIQNTQEMEPRRKANEVYLVFGDKMITMSLLLQSGITKTILCCDMWYLVNEVFLKSNYFGSTFSDICEHLESILEYNTEDQFSICFEDTQAKKMRIL